ncbi:MAG: cell division protein SepF [Propionibacteriaceae bacterium]|jgi:cell division inhibitor SepF|nr:cell division protein SepF [Propionibacteriaceae bacterium]
MADRLKKAAVWLGLVSDADYSADPPEEELTDEVEAREASSATVTDIETRRPVKTKVADPGRIVTIQPKNYNEARSIGESFRDGVPVIMNLTEMTEAEAKRLVDFSAGLIFGLHGNIERITSKVFLLSPPNITVTAEDKERLAGGFYNQS